MEAPVTIALFTDTDLQKRARKIARVGGVKNSQTSSCNTLCKIFLLNLRAMMPNKQVITGFECRSCGYELGTCFDGQRHWNQYYLGI